MTQDLTLQAAEALISAALPQDAARVHYLATESRPHEGDFNYVEIIADPYATELRDQDGIPSFATCAVLANFVAEDDEAAERFLRVVSGIAFSLSPAEALAASLPPPLDRLRIYAVETVCNGIDRQTDGTVIAQFQFTLTLRPLIIQQ